MEPNLLFDLASFVEEVKNGGYNEEDADFEMYHYDTTVKSYVFIGYMLLENIDKIIRHRIITHVLVVSK